MIEQQIQDIKKELALGRRPRILLNKNEINELYQLGEMAINQQKAELAQNFLLLYSYSRSLPLLFQPLLANFLKQNWGEKEEQIHILTFGAIQIQLLPTLEREGENLGAFFYSPWQNFFLKKNWEILQWLFQTLDQYPSWICKFEGPIAQMTFPPIIFSAPKKNIYFLIKEWKKKGII